MGDDFCKFTRSLNCVSWNFSVHFREFIALDLIVSPDVWELFLSSLVSVTGSAIAFFGNILIGNGRILLGTPSTADINHYSSWIKILLRSNNLIFF